MAEFDAFVLTGGQSERMGRDKALIRVGGVPMAARVASALDAAGATRVTCVGGNRDALTALGLDVIVDEHEGAGPLGGALVALRAATQSIAVLAPCDLLEPEPGAFVVLVGALATDVAAMLAVPRVDGVWRPLPCAARTDALAALDHAFTAGERAVHRAMATLARVEVDAGPFDDADLPGDLPDHR